MIDFRLTIDISPLIDFSAPEACPTARQNCVVGLASFRRAHPPKGSAEILSS